MRRTHVIINNPTFRVSALSAIYSLLASRLLRLIVLTVAPASSRLYALVDFSSRWRNEMSGSSWAQLWSAPNVSRISDQVPGRPRRRSGALNVEGMKRRKKYGP